MKVYRPVSADIKISSVYGKRIDPVTKVEGAMHYGYDFATPIGTPIVAAVTAKVEAAGWENENDHKQGFGLRVRTRFESNGKVYQAFYAHLSEVSVKSGETISAGTRVGLSGHTGKSSGPHLHFEVREMGKKGIEVTFDA